MRLEAEARELRYAVFQRHIGQNDVLLIAHHLDDQVETFLYRTTRGSGLSGLLAMNESRRLGRGLILRPLLDSSRDDLERYAREYRLDWVEDESNHETSFDRNYLRKQVIPLFKNRWPNYKDNLNRVIENLRQDKQLLDDYQQADLITLEEKPERVGVSLSIDAMKEWPSHRIKGVLRYWIRRHGFLAPSQAHLNEVLRMLSARSDSSPCVSWKGCAVRRYQHRLFLHRPLPSAPTCPLSWDGVSEIHIAQAFRLEGHNQDQRGEYQLIWRQEGLRCHPEGRRHSQTLKKLFQEYRVEPWLRGFVPLIYKDGELIAVADIWREQKAHLGEFKVSWEYLGE